METFLSDTTKTVLLGVIAVVFALSWLARQHPEIAWLHAFRLPDPHLTEEQKQRRRRAGNRIAGLEMIVAGVAFPLLYLAATVMMFNDFKTLPTILVSAGSILQVTFGVWVFWKNR